MKWVICKLIRGYQLLISPLLRAVGGSGVGCRFEPSCSAYFLEAVRRHGAWRGSVLGFKRLGRCHPWGGSGLDPVPPADGQSSSTTPAEDSPKESPKEFSQEPPPAAHMAGVCHCLLH